MTSANFYNILEDIQMGFYMLYYSCFGWIFYVYQPFCFVNKFCRRYKDRGQKEF